MIPVATCVRCGGRSDPCRVPAACTGARAWVESVAPQRLLREANIIAMNTAVCSKLPHESAHRWDGRFAARCLTGDWHAPPRQARLDASEVAVPENSSEAAAAVRQLSRRPQLHLPPSSAARRGRTTHEEHPCIRHVGMRAIVSAGGAPESTVAGQCLWRQKRTGKHDLLSSSRAEAAAGGGHVLRAPRMLQQAGSSSAPPPHRWQRRRSWLQRLGCTRVGCRVFAAPTEGF